MSARTPFVPTGKDSRTTTTKEPVNNSKTNTVFSPDLSNPLHASSNAQSAPKSQSKAQETSNTSQKLASNSSGNPSNTNNVAKPLNISSFKKAPKGNGPCQNQNQNASTRRPSFAGNPTGRPGTADPHSKTSQNQQAHHQSSDSVVAPIPRQAIRAPSPLLSTTQSSGIFSSSTFKTPSLPQNAPSDKPNDAHTSTSLNFSFAKPMEQQQHNQLPSPPTSIRISSSRTFESSHAVIDLEQEMPSFSLNTSLPNQTGPQRVLLNADGNRSNITDQDPRRGNQLKRPHDTTDVNDAKRYKNLAVSPYYINASEADRWTSREITTQALQECLPR